MAALQKDQPFRQNLHVGGCTVVLATLVGASAGEVHLGASFAAFGFDAVLDRSGEVFVFLRSAVGVASIDLVEAAAATLLLAY